MPAVHPITQAQKVREELFRITGQSFWNRDDYWKFYLRGRREIFDAIYNDLESKDWLNPATAQRVDQEFKLRATERWKGQDDKWILEGEWLTTRLDIAAWMRSTYWKHNNKRLALEGPKVHQGMRQVENEIEKNPETIRERGENVVKGVTNNDEGRGGWKDVMLL
ncbi:hypothetical protein G7Y89_g10115 [Cudoniella acicularis]|uniref:Uncharacterized protein n=1 Tax=Cudoniella acicularis TaxID=354080 RepID=A0A8H4W192_9HELO|nr:hypothetical protein G7Y89_g10115 [Cudoniella acicularis]